MWQTAEEIFQMVRGEFIGRIKEACMVVGYNPTHQFLFQEVIQEGTIDKITCPIENFFAPILQHRATKMVVVHNHPCGVLVPSKNDLITTRALWETADLFGITLVDHLIVYEERFLSMYALGHIPLREEY